MSNRPTTLIIMDGFALTADSDFNAISRANTPNLDMFFGTYPWCLLSTSGTSVGLMEGQMGDSNVGHLNIGAGRVVMQILPRIMQAINSGSFFENAVLSEAIDKAACLGGAVHIMGLLSDGGVHSHIKEVYALLDIIAKRGEIPTYIHAFLDGRDVPPKSAKTYIGALEDKLVNYPFAKIATVSGRYYAMDRDKRWERTELAFDAMVHGKGAYATSAIEAVEQAYQQDITDEFVVPTVVVNGTDKSTSTMKSNDAAIFFNFRADRARQISTRLLQVKGLHLVGMAEYDEELAMPIAFPPDDINETLGEVVSKAGLRQLRAAETEKYAHVTFFLNGGREEPFDGEDRVLVPSPKVSTYDNQPKMSAYQVAETVVTRIREDAPDLVVVNFANCDMVGHTGNLTAAIKAVEAVDECVNMVVEATLDAGGSCIVTADHGNAEQMIDEETGEPYTAHTRNDVPCIVIADSVDKLRQKGCLADIAPTVLQLMKLRQPEAMTGRSLIT